MLIGDEAKLLPSNAGAGYVLRRLIFLRQLHRQLQRETKGIIKIKCGIPVPERSL